MKTEIKIAPYAPLLIYQKGYTPEFVFETIKKNNLLGLRIFAYLNDTKLSSVDFLSEYTFLETLHISSVNDFNFEFLHNLKNLKELSIGVEGNNPIDLSSCTKLERLFIDWRKNITGIESCERLSIFSLYGCKESDLSKFKDLINLKKLIIKTCGFQTLNGINALVNLEDILLGNCRKLTSVKDINGVNKLENLEFNGCAKINDFSSLNDLPNLKKLYLTDCKKIDSIKFINAFPLLKEFGLLGNTDIVDGDVLPAKDIKHLRYNHRSHYNVIIASAEADALEKKNIEKIKTVWKENF
jgi:hypothetical protein